MAIASAMNATRCVWHRRSCFGFVLSVGDHQVTQVGQTDIVCADKFSESILETTSYHLWKIDINSKTPPVLLRLLMSMRV